MYSCNGDVWLHILLVGPVLTGPVLTRVYYVYWQLVNRLSYFQVKSYFEKLAWTHRDSPCSGTEAEIANQPSHDVLSPLNRSEMDDWMTKARESNPS